MLLTPEDLEAIREAVEIISKGHATRWDIGTKISVYEIDDNMFHWVIDPKVSVYKMGDGLIRIDIRK